MKINFTLALFLFLALYPNMSSKCQTSEEYNSSGVAKEKLGDYRGAIASYSLAINTNPKNERAYYN